LCLHLFIVDFVVLLGSSNLLDVGIYDQVYGPSEHFFDGMHLRAVRALIEELLGDLATELGCLLLH
jgi:hypothetical protein